jgi:hypothetical protein
MSNSIEALNLPLQLFAVGTAIGMTGALIHFSRTGDLGYWPVFVGAPSIVLFYAGLLQTAVRAIAC